MDAGNLVKFIKKQLEFNHGARAHMEMSSMIANYRLSSKHKQHNNAPLTYNNNDNNNNKKNRSQSGTISQLHDDNFHD